MIADMAVKNPTITKESYILSVFIFANRAEWSFATNFPINITIKFEI